MIETKNNKLIVVLGMHRSGTSTLTRGLQVMGVELGDKMLPILEDNPTGFWEDSDLTSLNIEMLAAIDSHWSHLALISSRDIEILREKDYFLRAVNLLRHKVCSNPVFGFKDPRVAKLLPFWKEVFRHCQFEVSYLLVVRNPLSVVKSLAKRDSFEAERGYLLWLGHVITSLTGSTGDRRVLVDYDHLMQSPDHELQRIAKKFDLEIDPKKLLSYKTDFLDQGLRHTVYELNDLLLDHACSPIVREVYAALFDVASDNTEIDDLENKVTRWAGEFESLKSPLVLIEKLTEQNRVDANIINEREGQIVKLNRHITSLNQYVAERDERITQLHRSEIALQDHILSIRQTIDDRDRHIVNLSQEAIEALRIIEEMRESLSWRVTAPLRFISLKVKVTVNVIRLLPGIIRYKIGIKKGVLSSLETDQT